MSITGKQAEIKDQILKRIRSITPDSDKNEVFYKAYFDKMSNEEFDRFIDRLENKQERLTLIVPNLSDVKVDIQRNIDIAESMGHEVFTRIWIVGQNGLPDYLTPVKHMVIPLPIRRVSQTMQKKISVPKDSRIVNSLTGQVTGDSRGASLSAPEIQLLLAVGFEDLVVEAIKYRGGDVRGGVALDGMLAKHGRANLKTLGQFASGVESTRTLSTYLTACHLLNNL